MPRPRALLAALPCAALIALWPAVPRAGALNASASCVDGSHITFTWSFYEDPFNPTGYPEWVGYDVLRRSVTGCGAFVRLNATPYPRTPGASESFSYTETPPASGTMYDYQVILVDASRQQLFPGPQTCDCVAHDGWASCPEFSAAITRGSLIDIGWALYIQPCPDACSQSFTISGPQADALRPYAGTGTVLRFYGQAACGSFEGCSLNLDRFDLGTCAPTPVRRSTWGSVKAIYR
jgi:hypothetical protein